eukprot:4436673-Amphidinium_carterae.1
MSELTSAKVVLRIAPSFCSSRVPEQFGITNPRMQHNESFNIVCSVLGSLSRDASVEVSIQHVWEGKSKPRHEHTRAHPSMSVKQAPHEKTAVKQTKFQTSQRCCANALSSNERGEHKQHQANPLQPFYEKV